MKKFHCKLLLGENRTEKLCTKIDSRLAPKIIFKADGNCMSWTMNHDT